MRTYFCKSCRTTVSLRQWFQKGATVECPKCLAVNSLKRAAPLPPKPAAKPKRKRESSNRDIIYAPGGSWEQRIADGTSYPDPHTAPPFIPTCNVYRCKPTLQ